tara:strand:- start:522 stop:968 length:447 start_codon:yes stop_codon:yes gene_type:complete
MYENPWYFNDKPFETEDIEKFQGFVYLIINQLNDKKYIGRKYFYNVRKKKNKRNRVRTESNWKEYYGSSETLLADIEEHGKNNFKRYILSLHTTRGDTNYEEVKQQFLQNVLETDGWYNSNINAKWQKKPIHIVEGRKYSEILTNKNL